VSTSRITKAVRRTYATQNSTPIENDCETLRSLGVDVIEADLLMKEFLKNRQKVRHNPAAIARVAVDLAMRGRMRRMANSTLLAKLR
jgi:hypothetical protein